MSEPSINPGFGRRTWIPLFLLVVAVILLGGYGAYRSAANQIRREKSEALTAIGKLKAGQIEQWRKERLADAARSAESPFVRRSLQEGLNTPDWGDLCEQWRQRLIVEQKSRGYADTLLIAPDGTILLSAKDDPDPVGPATRNAIEAVMAGQNPALSDFYRGIHGHVHVDAVVAIKDDAGKPMACLVMRSNAETYLYPLIQFWPTPSRSAETALIERNGNEALFLNELRFQAGTALNLRVPLSHLDRPSVQAALGKTGLCEGMDYRGHPVLTYLRPIEGSNWIMLAKIDRDEILAEARGRARLIGLFVVVLILLTMAVIASIYRWREAGLFRAMYRAEREKLKAQEQFRAIFETASVGIAQTDPNTGGWIRVNEKMCEIIGYSADELTRMKVSDVTHPDDRQRDRDAFLAVLNGEVSHYRLEKRYVRKDGTPAWVNVNITLIRDEQGRPISTVEVVEDIGERKRVEAELRASEERYRRLFDEAIEGIVLADAETGIMLECNQSFLQLTGYEKPELIGQPQRILHPPEAGQSPVSRTFAMHRENHDRVLETRLVTKDGLIREVAIKAHVLEIAGQKALQGSFRDITEERRGQREREATFAMLRLLNDRSQLHELIRMVLELVQHWTGCEAIGIRLRDGDNFPYYETKGFPAEFILAENQLCHLDANGEVACDGDGKPDLECMCGRILNGGVDKAVPYFTAQGSFWTNSTSELLAGTTEAEWGRTRNRCHDEGYESVALIRLGHGDQIVGLLQLNDRASGRFTPELIQFLEQLGGQIAMAIAQRQAEDALRENREKFQRLVEWLQDEYFFYQKDRSGVFTYLSPSVSYVLGYSPDELMVHSSETLTDAIINKVAIYHAERGLSGEPQPPYEVVIRHKDGALRHLEVFEIPLFDRMGKVTSVEGIARNISERKRADEEREKLEAQLRQAQKMESIGRLAGGVAHDFNNMLNVITGYSEMALDRIGSDDPMRRFFQEILSAAERSAGLTRQLLAFARRQTISPKLLDLNSTIEGMLNMLGRLIGEDTRLDWQPAADLWPVMMDPAQIDQILANLTVNARDAIAGIGRIAIRTGNVHIKEAFRHCHDEALPGDYVLVEISDTGSGMSREIMAHIFEPFFTTKAKGLGTGLGLATVYGIVKQNNGFIDVRSEPGRGTTFEIYLPRHETAPVSAETTQRPGGTPRGTETVLLVEDETALLKLATYMLESLGYTVLAASSPIDAVETFMNYGGEIHLLLTDVIMPEMSGRDLRHRLQELRPGIKCLFMSGYTADVIAHRGVLERGVHFLQKPFTLEALAAKMREALA